MALDPPAEARVAWERRHAHLASGPLDAGSRRLLPLVRWNLGPVLDAHEMADPLLVEAARIQSQAERTNRAFLHDAAALAHALAQAGIEVLLLKGAALILTSYPAPGLRPMVDLDLLVPRDALAAATGVFRRCGWAPLYPLTAGFVRTRHAAPFRSPRGGQCDLHWDLFEEHCPPQADAACWAASRAVDLLGTTVRILAPADQLFHVVIHGTRWARTSSVRWVADAVRVLGDGGIDWSRLAEQAEVRCFVFRLGLALEYLRAARDAPVPDDVLRRHRAHSASRRERFEYWARAREHRVLGFLPFWVANYLRSVAPPRRPTLQGLIDYLKAVWGAESALGIVSAVLARAISRLRRARSPGPAARAVPRSASGSRSKTR
jgi:hypothetical protein